MAKRPRYTREDRRRCEGILKETATWQGAPLPFLLAATGRLFLGAPYAAGTLEGDREERLVVNLRAFDCVTFVEAALALAIVIGQGLKDFSAFLARLERIRYRNGRCVGFASRLHYFTDWLNDAGRKGILRDITASLGGLAYEKTLNALSSNRERFPALADRRELRRLRLVEGICSRRRLHFLPKAAVRGSEGRLAEGDIIAVTTEVPGMDVSHVGIAVPVGDRIHLLHASSLAGRVLLSEEPLAAYLERKKDRTGIIVARPRERAALAEGRPKGGRGR